MKLVVTTFLTMDGVMQAPGGPQEDTSGGFRHGGWLAPHFDETLGEVMTARMGQADAFLLGRRTYEIFAAHWPGVDNADDPIADSLNRLPKHVASRTLDRVEWQGAELIDGEVPQAVAELKKRPGRELQVHGSADLVHTLAAHDLVDAYQLLVFPVLLGSGKRLFAEGLEPTAFALTEARTSSTGVTVQVYERTGRPEYGLVGS
ncbi:dihydrofolate reductase family protein [Streptomyces sp. XM4193]|uniref:dihydrofolate reductase family protein n=1 Tax=Streptomyces sp. XM4193 TaxID=2929782 RepID=UPI001FFA1C67|nr:dihydrofolate reductase family protein [Streptomyces sp. XM4193]MCK1796911.1 dihydrofolate reductase family protein [Streptomyces sp. XM4193]